MNEEWNIVPRMTWIDKWRGWRLRRKYAKEIESLARWALPHADGNVRDLLKRIITGEHVPNFVLYRAVLSAKRELLEVARKAHTTIKMLYEQPGARAKEETKSLRQHQFRLERVYTALSTYYNPARMEGLLQSIRETNLYTTETGGTEQ